MWLVTCASCWHCYVSGLLAVRQQLTKYRVPTPVAVSTAALLVSNLPGLPASRAKHNTHWTQVLHLDSSASSPDVTPFAPTLHISHSHIPIPKDPRYPVAWRLRLHPRQLLLPLLLPLHIPLPPINLPETTTTKLNRQHGALRRLVRAPRTSHRIAMD